MQKLKLAVLNKMHQSHLTGAEVNFIIHISHFQDDQGNVLGIYYQDVCRELGISPQKFYDLLRSLEAKNIIQVSKDFYSDWNVQILDNDFSYPEAFSERYLNMAHNIFYDKCFLALKAGEKLLAMELLKISETKESSIRFEENSSGSYCIGLDRFYEKYTELVGVTKRIIQRYLTSLRGWFSIGIQKKLYWITPLRKVYKQNGIHKDAETYNAHVGKVICRRERISFTKESFQDTVELISQYGGRLKDKVTPVFLRSVKTSLTKSNEGIRNPYRWERILRPKLIHKLINEYISIMGI